jgi:hypothetical protein
VEEAAETKKWRTIPRNTDYTLKESLGELLPLKSSHVSGWIQM